MLKIQKIHELATFEKAHESDIGYDLTACDYHAHDRLVGGRVLLHVHLGVKVSPHRGTYLMVVPRSSFSKIPLIMPNSPGIIDPDYRGELMMPVRLSSASVFSTRFTVENIVRNLLGKKIAQAVLMPIITDNVRFVERLNETERGEGGFGSTDREDFEESRRAAYYDAEHHPNEAI